MTSPNYIAAVNLGWSYFYRSVARPFLQHHANEGVNEKLLSAAGRCLEKPLLGDDFKDALDVTKLEEACRVNTSKLLSDFDEALTAIVLNVGVRNPATLVTLLDLDREVRTWLRPNNSVDKGPVSVARLMSYAPCGAVMALTNSVKLGRETDLLEANIVDKKVTPVDIFELYCDFVEWGNTGLLEIIKARQAGYSIDHNNLKLLSDQFPELADVLSHSICSNRIPVPHNRAALLRVQNGDPSIGGR